MSMTADEIRQLAEDDLRVYARLVNPHRVYGEIHDQVFVWLMNNEFDQLLLLPRAHMKSHCIAVWVAWWLTKNPDTTILYVSATHPLAKQQLYAIKQMIESPVYRRYWPEMVHAEENRRDKWTETEIKVDHPARRKAGVRDASILATSIDANTTGLHCDVLVLDDIVVPGNAYTETGRNAVNAAASQFSSILNPGAFTKACGTRYHPSDVYGIFIDMVAEDFDAEGNVCGERKVWDVLERPVEVDGVFLWPRTQHPESKKWFGFNARELARVKAKYLQLGEHAQFFAQYYNDPNSPGESRLDKSKFMYYNRDKLRNIGGVWYYADRPLAIFAAADFAYTTGKRSDYTAFAVIGLDHEGFIYILDLDRFKSSKYEDYYQAGIRLYRKWMFKRIRVETNAGANIIGTYMQDRVREEGLTLVVDCMSAKGDKVERIAAILEPRYEIQTIWHPRDGLIHAYEEEVLLPRPAHDDLKDAVAAAIEISKPPAKARGTGSNVVQLTGRFGGMRR